MKKRILFIATVMFTAGAIVLTGCNKEDVTPPEIMLTGPATVDVSLNGTYNDQGATATDDEDGDITSLITNDAASVVDVNNVGSYTVTYTVSDAAGNTASATRTVNVKNDAANVAGNYSVTESCSSLPAYLEQVTASSTNNNRMITTRFGNYDNTPVYFVVNGNSITVPTQTVPNSGTPPNVTTRTFDGTGTISGNTITINYNETTSAGGPFPCTATYVKQ